MDFNICEHHIRDLVLKAGVVIRQLKGLPEEKNITVLYNETAPLLGITPFQMHSGDINHLPAPAEVRTDRGAFAIPRKDCEHCGGKETVVLYPLCQSCEEAEGGKYKAAWTCQSKDCGYKEKLEKPFIEILEELGVEIPNGASKQSLGIKTMTDEGLK